MGCMLVTLDDNRRKRIFKRRKQEIKWLSYTGYNGGCDVLILPYSNTEIDNMRDKKLLKIASRIKDDIYGENIFLCANNRLRNIFRSLGIYECSGEDVFLDVCDIIMRKCAKNMGYMNNEVGIYDYHFTNKSVDLIRSLSQSFGNVVLFTENASVARTYIEDVLEDNGMPVTVTDDFDRLSKINLLAAVGKIEDGVVNPEAVIIDLFNENAGRGFKRISKVLFSIPEGLHDVISLTDRRPDQDMVEFILMTGVRLTLSEDIKIAGYE